ncbi:chromate efflux transporter [Celeribacter ethanolicus]|uniref:Chromate transporter n=1 Tax=Celeribacter ethanolicus TaxID=1758178 RepID=A0A291G9D4_9RHOB|nr:chromate efflux transporter [Celeribacter ethanolicus]ATG46652.1 chromate transporter [Celeribacter ethanolicus]TNE66354.1 MAG: chromate efflux transporter [Paracoccaceae bacterium]
MTPQPPLSDFLKSFARIGLLSFGGPAAQIAVMHREIVEDRRWMEEDGFLSALSFCMMLPGPEAMQLATYCGWRLKGVSGGIVAGLFFVLPGALVMLALAALYAAYGHLPASEALFLGVKATVVIVVLQALVRLSRKALGTPLRKVLALAAFVLIAGFAVPFPLIVLGAGLVGALTTRSMPKPLPTPKTTHLPRTLATWGALWAAPLALLWATGQERLLAIGLFFSKLAVVTFGGAYAVLAYMSQEVVTAKAWLAPEAMLDGLGLAETTPGPLILVTEFVGYMAATPLGILGGVAGALVTLWVTFIPCFLWIFAGAPYIDWMASRPRIDTALKAVTAAVVGVIASLSWWFALHVFFTGVNETRLDALRLTLPDPATFEPLAAVLAGLAALLLFGLKRSLMLTIALVALAGLGLGLGLPASVR